MPLNPPLKKHLTRKDKIKDIFIILIGIIALIIAAAVILNTVVKTVGGYLVAEDYEELSELDADCILVLGAGAWDDKPCPMLEDRLKTAIDIYKNGLAPAIILSGDGNVTPYSEPHVMYTFSLEQGVEENAIYTDYHGYSTYESIQRAKEVFGVKKIIIVTQSYHLPRALYIAQSMGLEAMGFPSDLRSYRGQYYFNAREGIARVKEFITCNITHPEALHLEESFPVGNLNGSESRRK